MCKWIFIESNYERENCTTEKKEQVKEEEENVSKFPNKNMTAKNSEKLTTFKKPMMAIQGPVSPLCDAATRHPVSERKRK